MSKSRIYKATLFQVNFTKALKDQCDDWVNDYDDMDDILVSKMNFLLQNMVIMTIWMIFWLVK